MDIILARTVTLLVVAILVAIAARRLSLPYTVGLVVTGVGFALLHVDFAPTLTHDFIFDVILPPLLFEAALSLRWRELRRDMLPIMTLSILGVVVSAAVVAAGMVCLLGWPLVSALVFGVLIAATDPVAVIAMFKDTGVKGRLRLLVESESLFNDGVAAVFFGLVLAWANASGGAAGPAQIAVALVLTSGGGVAIGLVCGAAALLLAGRTNDQLAETAMTTAAAYGSFLLAEHFHVSGVLATVAAGLLMGNVAVQDAARLKVLSEQARDFVVAFWDFAAFVANSFVFLMIGVAAATIPFSTLGAASLSIAIALVLAGRLVTVYPLCLLFRWSRWEIPFAEQHVLWWGGLRGALALALALALPGSLPLRNEILIATFGVVTFSVIVQGLTMKPLLRRLGLLS
ncbi:MAG TPA: sodium:proton antiporter [Rhizomicrobium sp.]|jgi:CPA1 family monovalent cation:H+ antiporter|nr:sodium:proton antiporter [Rhizomicrobium sp.]